MTDSKNTSDDPKELALRAMAISFRPIDEKFRANRTETFITLATHLKAIQEEAQEALSIINSGKGFNELSDQVHRGYSFDHKAPGLDVCYNKLREWSADKLWDKIFHEAQAVISSGVSNGRVNSNFSVEAASWILYFTTTTEKIDAFKEPVKIPNQRWYDYYNENYPCSVPNNNQ